MPDLKRSREIEKLQNLLAQYERAGGKLSPKAQAAIDGLKKQGLLNVPTQKKGEAPLPFDPTLRKPVRNASKQPKEYPTIGATGDTGGFDDLMNPLERSDNAKNKSALGFLGNVAKDIPRTVEEAAKGLISIPSAVIGSQVSGVQSLLAAKDALARYKKTRNPQDAEEFFGYIDESRASSRLPLEMALDFVGAGKEGVITKVRTVKALRDQQGDKSLPASVRAEAKRTADRMEGEIWTGIKDQTYERPALQAANVAMGAGAAGKAALGSRIAQTGRAVSRLEKSAKVAGEADAGASSAQLAATQAKLAKLKLQQARIASTEHDVTSFGIPKALGMADAALGKRLPGYTGVKAKAVASLTKPIAPGLLNKGQGKIAEAQMLAEYQDLTDPAWREGQAKRETTDILQEQVQDFARGVQFKKGEGQPPAPTTIEGNPPTTPPANLPDTSTPPNVPTPEATPLGGRVSMNEYLGEPEGRVTITKGVTDEAGNFINPQTEVQGGGGGLGGIPIDQAVAKRVRSKKSKAQEATPVEVTPEAPVEDPAVTQMRDAYSQLDNQALMDRHAALSQNPDAGPLVDMLEQEAAKRGLPLQKPAAIAPETAPAPDPLPSGFDPYSKSSTRPPKERPTPDQGRLIAAYVDKNPVSRFEESITPDLDNLDSLGADTSGIRKQLADWIKFNSDTRVGTGVMVKDSDISISNRMWDDISANYRRLAESGLEDSASLRDRFMREGIANPDLMPMEQANHEALDMAETGKPISVVGMRSNRGESIPGTGKFWGVSRDTTFAYSRGNFFKNMKTRNKGGNLNDLAVENVRLENPFVVDGGHAKLLREIERQGIDIGERYKRLIRAAGEVVRKNEDETGYQVLDKIAHKALKEAGYDGLVYRKYEGGKALDSEVVVFDKDSVSPAGRPALPEPYVPDTASPYYMGNDIGNLPDEPAPTPAAPTAPTPRYAPEIMRGWAARILHDNPPGSKSPRIPNLEGVTVPEITEAINEAGRGIVERLGLTPEEAFGLETELDHVIADTLLKTRPGSPLTPTRFREALARVAPDAGVGPEPWKEYENGGLADATAQGKEALTGGASEGIAPPIGDGLNPAADRVPGEQGDAGSSGTGTATTRPAAAPIGAAGTGLAAIVPLDWSNPATAALTAAVGIAGVGLLRAAAKYGAEGLGKLKSRLETDSAAAKRVDSLLSQYVEAVLPRERESANAPLLEDGSLPEIEPATAEEIAQVRAGIVKMVQMEMEMRPQKGVPPEQAANIADEFVKVGDRIAQTFETLGEELVNAGLIPKEAYAANKGRYLRRIYQMWEDPEGYMQKLEAKLKEAGVPKEQVGASLSRERQIFEKATGRSADNVQMTGNAPSGRLSRAKLSRRKLTDSAQDAETRDFLGEIGLSSIRVRRGGEISARELSKASLSKSVADNFSITSKRVKELDELRDMYEESASQPSDSDFATSVERTYYYHPEIFDQVERNDNLKGLGHLEGDTFYGHYIPASIRKELISGEYKPTTAIQKYMMMWKVSKTAFNPGSWAGNVMGNVMLAYLGGGMRALNPENFARASASLRNRDSYFQMALDHSDHPYESLRMEITTREHLDPSIVYPDNLKHAIQQAGRKGKDAVTNLYGGIDTVFKHALFMDTLDRLAEIDPGMTAEARAQIAAQQVAKTFPNFRHGTPIRLLRPAVKQLRRGAAPFISWDASVIPLAARLIMEHPTRAALFPAMYEAYQKSLESWMASQPGGSEAYDEEKRAVPDYMDSSVRLPIARGKSKTTGEEDQSAFYIDSKPLNPLTGITDFGSESGSPLDAVLQRLNPIFSTLEQVRSNRKTGTDIPIVGEGDDDSAKARAIAGFTAQQLVPYATQFMQAKANLTGKSERPQMRDNGKGEARPTYDMDRGERIRQAARLARISIKEVDIPKELRNKGYGLRDALKAQRVSGKAAQRDAEARKGDALTEDEAVKAVSPSVQVLQRKVKKVRGGG